MEETGFKVYRDFKTSQRVVDIYAVLSTIIGDFTMVVACKNYDKHWEVGLDVIKEMEMVGRSLKVSKVVIATSSSFSPQARSYASEKNIELIDRDNLIILAKKFSKEHNRPYNEENNYNNDDATQKLENSYDESYYTDQTLKSDDYVENSYEHDFKAAPNSSLYHSKHYKSKTKSLDSNKRISSGVKKNLRVHPFTAKASKNYNIKSSSGTLNKRKIEGPKKPLSSKIKSIFNNTIVLILLVVAITHLASLIINNLTNIPIGVQGLVKMFSSLVLSYGLVFTLNHEGTAVLLKGTIVFFVSLIISILMIIFL